MRRFPAILPLTFLALILSSNALAQEQPIQFGALNQILPDAPSGAAELQGNIVKAAHFYVQYSNSVLTADSGTINLQTGEVQADGHVRIAQGQMIWVGDHINYNFKTRRMSSAEFRAGRPPLFLEGRDLHASLSNNTYSARRVVITTDDASDPAILIRASRFRIVPGKYVEAWNAVLYVDGVPSFYFPYYHRALGARANHFSFLPGYRTKFGPYLLTSYRWYWNNAVDGVVRADYRERRGGAGGANLNLHLNRWGEASFLYYHLHDINPYLGTNGVPGTFSIPRDRQRFRFAWQAAPFTNLDVKALVNYQSDPLLLHDFFEGAYTENPQPRTFAEINRHWQNWSVDAETTPRVNDFFDQVERLPDVKLTGWRQQVPYTPLYYESESSAGYYRRMFAETNTLFGGTNGPGADYAAARADTFQQLLLPWTFFGWLNVTPRVGGRFTYYGHESGPGGTNAETYRKIFNTGVDFSFKASRLWTGATNGLLDIDGLRHIIEPSASYAFIPRPSTLPPQLPQFDPASPSPLLLPIQLPDYNDIDSIDSENVIRFGLRNTFQTKRSGQVENLADWDLIMDWRLHPTAGQSTFSDLFSDLEFRPRSWLTLESEVRYDIGNAQLNLAYHQITFTPNDRWSWALSHDYTRAGFVDSGDNLIGSTLFFRLNDNWGLRAQHDFNAENGRLQDQFYTLYRDMRSWTGALTFRVTDNGIGPTDYTVAFAFSIKAHPRYAVGADVVAP
ncbi:MAG: LPS assembly protein LptD, partial [Verrucomicrobia bacterium]|nr:LPS assembly protein LptD [Verrucomicrobiota bacterium]